jgi:antitoxin HicB
MHYTAITEREGKRTTIEFPDCPGCVTFAESGEDELEVAREALDGWLEAHLIDGESPPRPAFHARAKRGQELLNVDLPPALTARLQIRWAREDAKLSQGELAKRMGMTRQQLSRIESSESNLTLATLERIAAALGAQWDMRLVAHGQ